MKRMFVFSVTLFVLVFMSGSALAGPPNLLGTWEGSGRAIFMDGTVVELSTRIVFLKQDGNLFAASFSFVEPGVGGWLVCPSFATGDTSQGNTMRGVVQQTYVDIPIATFDAILAGKTIRGVVRDFEDISTAHFEVRWVSDSLDPGCHN